MLNEQQRLWTVVRVASTAQAFTILLTWHLWNHRLGFVNLPVVHAFSIVNWAWPLLVLALFAAVLPRVGAPMFVVGMTAAILGDQMRLQPEVLMLSALMLLPFMGRYATEIGRWLMASLWIWSGLNKMLSPGWKAGGGNFIARTVGSPELGQFFAVLVPASELMIGIAALIPVLRPIVRWMGAGLQLGILSVIGGLGHANSAVWPWNVALAATSILLFAPSEVPALTKPVKVLAALLIAFPALFYVGALDAYAAFNLYSFNTANAEACNASLGCKPVNVITYKVLNVPFPPEKRLFNGWFNANCNHGETLHVWNRATAFDPPPTMHARVCPR